MVYRSSGLTDHSFRLSGVDGSGGIFPAWDENPGPLGTCGLSIQFDANESYQNDTWTISIPNKRSSQYLVNLNAYELALEQQDKAVTAARRALEVALSNEDNANADPTQTELEQVDAQIRKADAVLASLEASIADFVIKSPFAGVVTNVDMKLGETMTLDHTVRVIGTNDFKLTARIPEADIKGIKVNNAALVTFDASPDEAIPATISYISPLSTDVQGVSYYEAILALDAMPDWIREGLNADIDIIIDQKDDALVLPKQFIQTSPNGFSVFIEDGSRITEEPVELGLEGNNGLVEVLNLPAGTTVVIP